MVLRPSTNLKASLSSHNQTSKLSDAAKLEEIKKKIASKISESKEGKRKVRNSQHRLYLNYSLQILQVSVSGLSRRAPTSSNGRRIN